MSTLAENVQKVVNAHAGLKTALESKGVAVPDDVKLSDMPALVDRIETEWVKPPDWPDIKAMLDADTEAYEGKLFLLYELMMPGVEWQIRVPNATTGYAKIVVDDVEYTEAATVTPDPAKRYHIAKLYYSSKTIPQSGAGFPAIPMSNVRISETRAGIVARWAAANGMTMMLDYVGWIYDHRLWWRAFDGFTVDKSLYTRNVADHAEWCVQKYFKVVGAGGNCAGLFRRASNIREFDVSFTTPITNTLYMFEFCYSLVKTPDVLDLSQCTNCSNMFHMCTSLAKVPDVLDLSKCIDASAMFGGCYSLAKVPDVLDLSKCMNAYAMLNDCSCLRSVSFAAGSCRDTTDASYMFYRCLSLKSITFPEGFGQSLQNTNKMFAECPALEDVTGGIASPVGFDMHDCVRLAHVSLLNILAALPTVTEAQTLTLGATNLAKLTDEEKAIATGKGWTLA